MIKRALSRSVVPLAFGLFATGASAALVTIPGANFDLTYDDSALGLYGTPSLNGNVISFQPSDYFALSVNGVAATALDLELATISLQITVHDGFRLQSIGLEEVGTYFKHGDGSFVGVSGQTSAWDIAQGLGSQVTTPLTADTSFDITNPVSPVPDLTLHDWSATAVTDLSGFANTKTLGFTIQNVLAAFTSPSDPSDFRSALISKTGVALDVGVTPIPEPEVWAMMLVGVGLVGFRLRHRAKRASAARLLV